MKMVFAALLTVSFAAVAQASYVNADGVQSSLTEEMSQAEYDQKLADRTFVFPAKTAHVNVTPAAVDHVGAVSLTEDKYELNRKAQETLENSAAYILKQAQATAAAAKASGIKTVYDLPTNEVRSLTDDSDVKVAKALKAIKAGRYSFDPSNLESVEVVNTLGGTCVRNQTWGTSYGSLWVKGCSAIFKLTYSSAN